MPWKFLGFKQLDSYQFYKEELAARVASPETENEDVSQKIGNEIDAWKEFNLVVGALEFEARDPAGLDSFEILREGRKKYSNCYGFQHGPFTILYSRNPEEMTATPMTFFHYRDRTKRLQELKDFLVGLK